MILVKSIASLSICFLFCCTNPSPINSVQPEELTVTEFTTTIMDTVIITPPNIKLDTIRKLDSIVYVGFVDSYEKNPPLEFITATKTEFENAAPIQRKLISKRDSLKPFHEFQTSKHILKFNSYNIKEGVLRTNFYNNKNWHLFTTHSTSEGLGFGTTIIVDSLSATNYAIISITDWSVETPSLSNNGEYLVYYDNFSYDPKDCFVGILKIDETERDNPTNYLTPYRSFNSKEWAVEELRWLSNNSFIIKGYENIYDETNWVKLYKYIKTTF